MKPLRHLLTAAVATALGGGVAHAESVEQKAERAGQKAEQTYEHGKREVRQESREARNEAHDQGHATSARAGATDPADASRSPEQSTDRTRMAAPGVDQEDRQEDASDAREQVSEAIKVVEQMKQDPQLTRMLQQTRGVFIVPEFGKGAAVVGARGGEGVLLVNDNGEWSQPAFYNFGRLSVGAQAGGAGGSVAMLLMSEEAVNKFKGQENNWSLDASAGLTIVNYTADTRAAADGSDVIVWSDTQGLFAGASVGVGNISRDDSENAAYYDQRTTPQQIFSGTVQNTQAKELRDALPQVASR